MRRLRAITFGRYIRAGMAISAPVDIATELEASICGIPHCTLAKTNKLVGK